MADASAPADAPEKLRWYPGKNLEKVQARVRGRLARTATTAAVDDTPPAPAAAVANEPTVTLEAEGSSDVAAGDALFYLIVAILNVKAGVKAKVEDAVVGKLPSAAARGPKLLPRLAGLVASKAVSEERVISGVAGGLGRELPRKLHDQVGLTLDMQTIFVTGPLVVIQVTPTALQLEKLIETIGARNERAAAVSGWVLYAARCMGLEEVLEAKLKDVMMRKIMGKLEEMIPKQLNERAGFDAEVAALLPGQFPGAFFELTAQLGLNGLK